MFQIGRVDAEQVSVKARTIQSQPTFARHLLHPERVQSLVQMSSQDANSKSSQQRAD